MLAKETVAQRMLAEATAKNTGDQESAVTNAAFRRRLTSPCDIVSYGGFKGQGGSGLWF